MEIGETGAVKETLGSPFSERSTEEKHHQDPTVPVVQEAAGIPPRKDPLGRSSMIGAEFRSQSPTQGNDANVSEPAELEAELSHAPAAAAENTAEVGVVVDGVDYQQLPLPPKGNEAVASIIVDGVEPHYVALGEGEKVPIFEAVQVREEPHKPFLSEEDEALESAHTTPLVEVDATMLLEGEEAEICAPLSSPEVVETSFSEALVCQFGDNPHPSLISKLPYSKVSEGNKGQMSEPLAVEAALLPSPVPDEACSPMDQESMNVPYLEALDVASGTSTLVIEPEKFETNWIVGPDGTVGRGIPAPASVNDSFHIAEYDIQMTRGEFDGVGDDALDKDVVPTSATANDTIGFAGYGIEIARENVEAGEAVDSVGEDAEAAGSGDLIAEDGFSAGNRKCGRRRKRGRPTSKLQGTRFPAQKKDEEEVCFICFDGGDLVVCDRRGCPKVYHPSCVNRDESYFRSKGQWSCGWHICSDCQKSASYMCYTCTYSLCKVCVNIANFICIRGKKGFCESCMRTVLLMETSELASEKKGEVDFNDTSCWEYLFKDYWLQLKGKLSITLEELLKAKSASEMQNEEFLKDGQGASSDQSSAFLEENISRKKKLKMVARSSADEGAGEATPSEGMYLSNKTYRKENLLRNATPDSMIQEAKAVISTAHHDTLWVTAKKKSRKTANEAGAHNDNELEVSVIVDGYVRKKTKRKSSRDTEENLPCDENKEPTITAEDIGWASKELLEFVSHMKDGDKSILSQYDVQELLLDYVKIKNLRDPRKKSQIICDEMLQGLFGKPRVGHFEMLKLLESHFLLKGSSPVSDENQGGFGGTVPVQMGSEGSYSMAARTIPDKRLKKRKRLDNEPQINTYDYAAIDVHNINLMYLRRSMMEALMDDMSTFNEKAIGSFVRIRITGSSQRQELYRLVQVVGCGKAPEEYKTGKRRTDVMLEIVNLDKKEVITVDIISNQLFTEEECKRLRQSIKFGFISRLTVGEVQEKARVLQTLRVSDYIESEKVRLTHLRDRASEKGRIKEHRECVEKLQLLNTPEENIRRLNEVPEVHTDPKMDPSYESPEDERGQDEITQDKSDRPTRSSFMRRELISPRKDVSYNSSGVQKGPNIGIDQHRGASAQRYDFPSQEKNIELTGVVENPNGEAKSSPVEFDCNELVREPTAQHEPQLELLPAKVATQSIPSESEKIWHYKDPSGKIQGPFTLAQLRKWSKHFPTNLRIWRKSEQQEDSILLTDALVGNFQKDLPEWVPGFTNPIEFSKVSETTAVVNTVGDVASSSPSFRNIGAAMVQETSSTLQTKPPLSDARNVTASQSVGPPFVYQGIPPQNDRATSNTASTNLVFSLENKLSTGSTTHHGKPGSVNIVTSVNPKFSQQVADQPKFLPCEMDHSKKLLEESGTSTSTSKVLSMNGKGSDCASGFPSLHLKDVLANVLAKGGAAQQNANPTFNVSTVTGDIPVKQDLASCLSSESHGLDKIDKEIDRGTSSTESNTVPEVSPRDSSHKMLQNGPLDVNPTLQSNLTASASPQTSDASTYAKRGPEAQQSPYANSLTQESGTSFLNPARLINAHEQTQSQVAQPSWLWPQTVDSSNWALPTDTKSGEQPSTSLNASSMFSGVSAGVGTVVNCQNPTSVSADNSKPFPSPQLNNSTNTQTFQQPNMSWVVGANDVNNPGWRPPAQYQNFSNAAATVGNLMCATGVQGGFGTANLGWGMMAQGNINMPWAAPPPPPNVNIAWNSGFTMPPQGNTPANFLWGTPQGGAIVHDSFRTPTPQGNAPPYPVAAAQGNQNPGWPAPAAGNMNQNAWGVPNAGNASANISSGMVQENTLSTWDSAPGSGHPSSSSIQRENFRDRNPGSWDGGFHGQGLAHGAGRQSGNLIGSGNADGSSLPPQQRVCKFFENGYCKKGRFCNYIHS